MLKLQQGSTDPDYNQTRFYCADKDPPAELLSTRYLTSAAEAKAVDVTGSDEKRGRVVAFIAVVLNQLHDRQHSSSLRLILAIRLTFSRGLQKTLTN